MLDLIRHYQLDIMLMLGSICLALAYNLPRRPLPADTWTIDAAGGRRPHLLENRRLTAGPGSQRFLATT
ncbi:MAG: hypothetical protein IJ087_06825 [Eggerthellaceae bacterium]|nr:hypothetical protein [Eggerthellaceae bacterium]